MHHGNPTVHRNAHPLNPVRTAQRILYLLNRGHKSNVAVEFGPVVQTTEHGALINGLPLERVVEKAHEFYSAACPLALKHGFADDRRIAAGTENDNTCGGYGQSENLLRQTDKT